jgi:hypothetical protein
MRTFATFVTQCFEQRVIRQIAQFGRDVEYIAY